MINNSEKNGPELSLIHDLRITKFGKFLRATYLGELLQLYNILIGDMNFIGPRPERPHFHKKFFKEVDGWDKMLNVKPGLIGWAQINGYSAFSPNEKLKFDLYYINNKSFFLDLNIWVKTLFLFFRYLI